MTSPTNVGSVSVEVLADAKRLAKSLKAEVEKAFKDLDFSKAIQAAVGKTKISIPVGLDPNTEDIPRKVKGTRVPKVPVALDPLLAAFQQQVRRDTAALARQVNVRVPINADTAGLRAELGAQLAAVQRQTRIQVPTEPGDRTAYEARLKAQLAEVAARVKQTIHVDVDVDKKGVAGSIGSVFKGLSNLLPNIGGIASGLSDIGGAMQRLAGSSAQLGGNLAGAFEAATGPVGAIVGAMIAAAGAIAAVVTIAVTAGPAIGLLAAALSTAAGAAAAIPGALSGVGAAVGTLALGFKGIGAAFSNKPTGGGGGAGSVVNQARQIAAASRGVEAARRGIAAANRSLEAAERGLATAELNVQRAQQRAQQAQEAVNKARKDAAEDLDDLSRALRGAQLDEEDAALNLADAQRALSEAQATGDLPAIARAKLEYERAQLAVENATDATQDLGEQSEEAAAKGVEGSDKVQQALQDQTDALQGVKDAQNGVLDAQNAVLAANDGLKSSYDGLASAQDSLAQSQQKIASGGGATAAAVTKLAPAAQRFVDAVKALKPAFEDLRLGVQQRLFAGLDKTVTNLGQAWIPQLKITLGRYADTFNGFFKNLGKNLSSPKFISDISIGAEGARKGLEKIGEAVSGPLVKAFGTLSRVSGPFIEALGGEIAKLVTKFSEWVEAGDKSGGLQRFFANATKSMHDIFDIGRDVASIIGSIISIIVGRELKTDSGETPLEQFKAGLKKVADYLKRPEVQEGIRQVLEKVLDFFTQVGKAVKKIDGWLDKIKALKAALGIQSAEDRQKTQVAGVAVGGAIQGLIHSNGFDKTAAATQGQDVGGSLGDGFFQGLKNKLTGVGDFIAGLLWSGPSSLLGRIKAAFGIASPSTVMMQVGIDLIQGLLNGLTNQLPSLSTVAGQLKTTVQNKLSDAAGWLTTNGSNAASSLGRGIAAKYGELQVRATGLKTTVQNKLSDAGSWLTSHGRSAATSLGNGIANLYGQIKTRAAGLKTQVLNALSDAGSMLYNAGRNIVVGLGNGIIALGPWLGQKVREVVNRYVPKKVQEILGIASPSKVMAGLGREIPAGLAMGIEAGNRQVESAAAAMAAAALPQIPDATMSLSSDMAGVSASLNKSATLELAWAPGSTSDKVYRAIQDDIKLRWSGNVQAALGSS